MDTISTRPRSVTMLFWMVFLLGGWNSGRAIAISLNTRTLSSSNMTLAPQLRLGITLIWAVLFLGAAFALWQKRPFTRLVIPLLLSLYTIYELSLLVIYSQSPTARQSWPFITLLYGLTILFSIWALNRTAVKIYFTN